MKKSLQPLTDSMQNLFVDVCLDCCNNSYSFISPFLQFFNVESDFTYICVPFRNGNK